MNDVIVRYDEKMPFGINGYISEDENGDYNIYINPKLPFDLQRVALAHELHHIDSCDFSNELSIAEVEGF